MFATSPTSVGNGCDADPAILARNGTIIMQEPRPMFIVIGANICHD